MTTCPSGVHYMHLVDHARAHIEETYRRPWFERLLRALLARVLPYPGRFRLALAAAARLARPLARLLPARLRAMLRLAPPAALPAVAERDRPQVFPAEGARRMRVALLTGCAQRVLAPEINEATIRLLTRHGCEVVIAEGAGCCGALTHHMGQAHERQAAARANIAAWSARPHGPGSTRSSSTPRAAARRSRTTASCSATIRPGRRSAARVVGAGARRQRSHGRARARAGRQRAGPIASPIIPPARCSTASRSRRRRSALLARRGLRGARRAGGAPLLRLGRHLQPAAAGDRRRGCATARSRNIERTGADVDRRRQYRLHDADRRAARCRWCTPSSCSTGRPAGRGRRRSVEAARSATVKDFCLDRGVICVRDRR